MIFDEGRIKNAMIKLKITREEAEAMFQADEAIDKGADLFPLSPEQKQVEKRMRQADRIVTEKKPVKKERKKNETKADLIAAIYEGLKIKFPEISNLQIVNPERIISFTLNKNNFEFMLTQKRAKK